MEPYVAANSSGEPLFIQHAQCFPPFGMRLPARMSVLPFAPGAVALISPVPIDETIASEIAALGEVRYLIAPSLLHSLYLGDAQRRYPRARVLSPAALRAKRPGVRIDAPLEDGLPDDLARAVTAVRLDGAPSVDEFVFFHAPSRALVVADLAFNMQAPEGWFTKLVLTMVGCCGHFGHTRSWRLFVRDRRAFGRSLERVLALPFETIAVAHGEIVRERAREQLARAVAWALPHRPSLPSGRVAH